ncbi:MAG TPA: glutathione S-transferase family protein, partial [Thermoanaerobaculia bacterium]|nr:glutathione S-transferase family protein [Thermoanaerobaculia bacterium]
MALSLHYFPLSSFSMKALIALYEAGTPFEPRLVNLGDADSRAALRALWPIGRIPVLIDTAQARTIPESSIIIEYLDRHYPGQEPMLPADPDLARQTRMR